MQIEHFFHQSGAIVSTGQLYPMAWRLERSGETTLEQTDNVEAATPIEQNPSRQSYAAFRFVAQPLLVGQRVSEVVV